MALFRSKKQTGYDSWRLRVSPQVIEYSRAVLDDILATIAEAQHAVPQGGLEVAGLLFGTGDKHLVKILATRPIVSEHAYGPQFLLSERDHEMLQVQMAEARSDPELQEFVPVGWYVSRVRGEIALRESDRQTHSRHFPEVWQIALVLREDSNGSMSAGLFARGKDMMLPSEPTRLAEELGGKGTQEAPEPEPEPAGPEPAEPADQIPDTPAAPEPLPFEFAAESAAKRDARGKRRWVGFAAILVIMLVAAAAVAALFQTGSGGSIVQAASAYWQRVVSYWTAPPSVGEAPPFSLGLRMTGGQLSIRWNGNSPVFEPGTEAILHVQDGEQSLELPISGEDLLLGSMTYEPQTPDVVVTLRAEDSAGKEVVETARLIGRPSATEAADAEELNAEVERLRIALRTEERDGESLRSTLRTLEAQANAQVAAPESPTVSQTPPTLVERSPRQPVVLQQQPAALPGRPSTSPSSAEPPAAAAVNQSGTLIWNGLLEPGATLTIDGNRASDGTLAGGLPGTAVQVRAYPAETASNGLTVLSDEERLQTQIVIEEAGPRNQGQRTIYRYDPEAAASLSVVQPPSAGNDWSRIVLRASGRPISMIFIRWERVR